MGLSKDSTRKVAALFICLLFVHLSWANDNAIVEHYSTESGVPHETVSCVLKASDGFLWFGTWHGLCSFDGKEFKTYNNRHQFQVDIPPRKIQNLIEDKRGNLWIKTTDHKLYIFDKRHEQFHAIYNQLAMEFSINAQIIKMVETNEGNFLLLSKDKDLLLAMPSEEKFVEMELLYKSGYETGDSRLKENVLSESSDYINWIGMNYAILSCKKGDKLKARAPQFISESLFRLSCGFSCASFENDHLWLGNEKGEVFRVDLSDGAIDVLEGLSGMGEIQNILPTNDSMVYIAVKNRGVYALELPSGRGKNVVPSSSGIIDSFHDSRGLLWFVTDKNGVISFDPGRGNSHTYQFLDKQQVNDNLEWQDGGKHGIFFITRSGAVYLINHAKAEMKLLEGDASGLSGVANNKISDILYDDNGILWLTSYDHGIFQVSFPEELFHLFNPFHGFNASVSPETAPVPFKTLFQQSNGDIWLGSRTSEVFHFGSDGSLKGLFSQNYNIGNVYHIMEDREGTLWFSTKGNGLVRAVQDKENPLGYRFKRFLHDPAIPTTISDNDVYYTFQDSKGRIWVATFGGGLNLLQEEQGHILFKHKYNSFTYYPEYGQYMEVRAIEEDRDGRIWIGTTDGLMSLEGDFTSFRSIQFETYRNDLNISNNDVYCLYKDKEGTLWLSLFGVGLNKMVRYDENKKMPFFESFGVRNGINSDVILSIVEDDNRNLWLSTEKGISRFSMDTRTFRNFGKYDGLSNYSLEETSGMRLDDGTIWFGSKEGIVRFNPDRIIDSPTDYPIYIVDMKVSNENYEEWSTDSLSVKYVKNIVLKHNQSMFSIEFAALNYAAPNHTRYAYILEGYEKEWHITDKARNASYTNVPPGKYLFKVHAIDETNPSFLSESTLQIKILPPWWKSPWARVAYFLLLMILLYFLLRVIFLMIRMKNDVYIEQKVSDLKIKFFTNISHELRTPLTLIKGPIQELKENEKLTGKGVQYVNLMEKNTNHMLDLVNQILDFRKIENRKMRLNVSPLRLKTVIESFYDEFAVLSAENEISYDYHLLDEDIIVWADKDKLETVIRNIISNAFKFTKAGGSILVTGGVDERINHCFIRVEDTGIGIPKNKTEEIFERFSQNGVHSGTGIGLALSKELIALHHGVIQVESVQNEGSVFTIQLPLGKEHFKKSEVEFLMNDLVEEAQVNNNGETSIEMVENRTDDERSDLPDILIVEDNKSLCNFLQLQLEDSFNVHVAYDGEEGLKKVHLYHPDIVVTDQMMPTVSGLELLRQIRDDFQISHIPVIILTAKNDEETRIKSVQQGANAYITKPFNKKYLIARINQLLNERKVFREKLWTQDEGSSSSNNNYGEYLMKKDVEFLDTINQIIEDNLDNFDFNIDTIAVTLNISRSAFFKKLKSITGLAPVDLVKETRLRKAMELIKNSDLSVSEIAFSVGFKDPGYFGKCFKKKYKLTPRDYMNEYRNSIA